MMEDDELGDLYVAFQRAYGSMHCHEALRLNRIIYEETFKRWRETEGGMKRSHFNELEGLTRTGEFLQKWILHNPHLVED